MADAGQQSLRQLLHQSTTKSDLGLGFRVWWFDVLGLVFYGLGFGISWFGVSQKKLTTLKAALCLLAFSFRLAARHYLFASPSFSYGLGFEGFRVKGLRAKVLVSP